MKLQKKTLLVAAVILAIAGFTYWLTRKDRAITHTGGQRLIVGETVSMQNALIPIAEELGFFKSEGLSVERKPFPSGKESLDGLLANATDVCIASDLNIARAVAKGESLKILGTVDTASVTLVSKAKVLDGIDLKGKRIGVTVGTASERFIELLLQRSSLTFEDVDIINLRPQELVLAYAGTGQPLDAVALWDPFATKASEAVPGSSSLSSKDVYRFHFFLVTKSETLEAKSGALISFAKALIKAEAYIRENKSDSIVILSKFLKLDKNVLTALWSDHDYTIRLRDSDLNDIRVLMPSDKQSLTNQLRSNIVDQIRHP